jgi:hypothetical protein
MKSKLKVPGSAPLISKAGTDEQKTSQILKTEFKPFWQSGARITKACRTLHEAQSKLDIEKLFCLGQNKFF